MAMILEVLDVRSGGVRARVRVQREALPFTIGRAVDNDLVLDDPYADARHAQITVDDAGELVLEDLGSLNRLVVDLGSERGDRAMVAPGARVRIGRTTLRFRDPAEPVPAALPDADPAPSSRWGLENVWVLLAVTAVALAVVAFFSWLDSYEGSSASEAFYMALGIGLLGAIWAGIWAIAGRVIVHRFNFAGHLAVGSATAAAAALLSEATGWAEFLAPDSMVVTGLGIAVGLAILAAMVAGHLALASALPAASRWRAGAVTAAVVLAIGGIAEVVDNEPFTDVPAFSHALKPLSARWTPTITPDAFRSVGLDLRIQVDELTAEMNARSERH